MYTLKILRDAEFDSLPYKRAKTSLGLADAKTGVAFVRDTGYNDITKATISHELDELVNAVSPHEEDGIRYKSLASLGAGAGAGALSSMIPGLKNFSPAISAGAGALANRKGQPIQGALQGFMGGGAGSTLLGGGKGMIQGLTQPGGTFGKAIQNFMPAASTGALNYAGAIPGFGGVGTSNPTGVFAKFLSGNKGAAAAATPSVAASPMSSFGRNLPLSSRDTGNLPMNFSGLNPATTAPGAAVQTPSVLQAQAAKPGLMQGILDQFKNAAPGAAVSMMGNLFAPKVEVPDVAAVGRDLQAQLKSGEAGDPIAKELGMTELKRVLNQPLGTPPESAFTLGDIKGTEQKQEALKNLVNQWKGLRPGADFSNDPEFQKQYQKIEQYYDEIRQAQRDQQTFEYTQQQLQQKYNYMVQALGLDQAQMQQYMQLAQLEVDQLVMEYGLSVEEATQFKQLFGDVGQMMMQSTMPQQGLDVNKLLDAFKGGA